MKWTHIYDERPEEDSFIVTIQEGYESMGHYYHYIGQRVWKLNGLSWQDSLDYYKKYDMAYPPFWWIYAKDFPFPKTKECL